MHQPALVVLYAEDEGLISVMASDWLRDAGFEVLTAADGIEAAKLIDIHGQKIAGLVTDVRLGEGASGWELARQARAINHALPVIYTTGDSGHDWAAEGVPLSVLIQKPFVEAQLITALANLLNGPTDPPA